MVDMTVENPLGLRDRLVLGLTSIINRVGDNLPLGETPAERQGRMVATLYYKNYNN